MDEVFDYGDINVHGLLCEGVALATCIESGFYYVAICYYDSDSGAIYSLFILDFDVLDLVASEQRNEVSSAAS